MNRNLNRRIHPIAEADGLSPKKLVIINNMGIDVCLPDLGTPYWYVRVNPITGRFETRETSWQDYNMDRLRFASGNLFLTSKDAIDLEMQQNDLMDNMPPANPGYKSYH